MNIEFKCPQCGQMVTADEAYRGQVVQCPKCEKGIVVPRNKPQIRRVQNVVSAPRIPPPQSPRIQIPPHLDNTVNVGNQQLLDTAKVKIAFGILCGVNILTLLLVCVMLVRSWSSSGVSGLRQNSTDKGDNISMPEVVTATEEAADADVETNPESQKEMDNMALSVPQTVSIPKREDVDDVSIDDRTKSLSSDTVRKVVERICGGKRLTGKEWQKRLRKEFGIGFADGKLKDELARAGYWALRIEAPGLAIHVGRLTDSITGFIREGLGGGFTYPEWLPREDAKYIYDAYHKLEEEEAAFRERVHSIDLAFKESEFYITPEEEERIEQAARLEYAQPLFSSICFDSSRYLFCQKRLLKSLVSAEITDRRWKQLKEAQSKHEWLKMINIICGADKDDDGQEKFDKFPNTESIANAYQAILDYKWSVKVVFRKTGIKAPNGAQASDFRRISEAMQRMSEREIIANYGKDRWTEYNKLGNALKSISNTFVPYPVDLQVRVGRVGRDGIIKGLEFCHIDSSFKENGTFEFMIGDGSACVLFVDDEWYWRQKFSNPLRKEMAQYEHARQAYLSDLAALLTEAMQGRHDKAAVANLRKELMVRHEKELFSAIARFMGTTVTLPPLALERDKEASASDVAGANKKEKKTGKSYKPLHSDSTDYEGDVAFINLALNHGKNRFEEYEKERRELEELRRTVENNRNSGFSTKKRNTGTRSNSLPTGSLGGWKKTL